MYLLVTSLAQSGSFGLLLALWNSRLHSDLFCVLPVDIKKQHLRQWAQSCSHDVSLGWVWSLEIWRRMIALSIVQHWILWSKFQAQLWGTDLRIVSEIAGGFARVCLIEDIIGGRASADTCHYISSEASLFHTLIPGPTPATLPTHSSSLFPKA